MPATPVMLVASEQMSSTFVMKTITWYGSPALYPGSSSNPPSP